METNTIIYTTRIFSNLISNDIITKGISDVAFSIYGILFGLVDIKNPELEKTLETMDIKAQIQTIESLIHSINKSNYSSTLEISLHQLHEIICNIREDLKIISKKYIEHKTKYLYYWRGLNISNEIISLEKNNLILEKRLDMFMKVFQVENSKMINSKFKTD